LKLILSVTMRLTGSMIDTVPPISDDTHNSGTVGLEFRQAWTRIDQHIRDDLARRGIDEMRHVGRL